MFSSIYILFLKLTICFYHVGYSEAWGKVGTIHPWSVTFVVFGRNIENSIFTQDKNKNKSLPKKLKYLLFTNLDFVSVRIRI